MPTPSTRPFNPRFDTQLNIDALIAAPLIAASKANVVMVTGQTRALLENCFEQVDEKTYTPVMINMTLTRGAIDPDTQPAEGQPAHPEGKFVASTLVFSIPLICLIPINNLVVDKVNVDFDLEITAVSQREAKTGLAEGDPVIERKAALHGKISGTPGEAGSKGDNNTARLKVNVSASPLPLPRGLLSVLELYTKSIQAVPPPRTQIPPPTH